MCFFSSSIHPGSIFVTSTCDLFVAETSASTLTAILEQDVSFAAYSKMHGLNFSKQSQGNLRCLAQVTNQILQSRSDPQHTHHPALIPLPPASQHQPQSVFKIRKLLLDQFQAGVVAVKTFVYLYDAVVT